MAVSVILGNIFNGGTDLTILPCSKKRTISKTTNDWVTLFNLVSPPSFPYEMEWGGISEIYDFTAGSDRAKRYAFAAAVDNDLATVKSVFSISKHLAEVTQANSSIRTIETVLLGTGAGGLGNVDSAVSLATAFESFAHEDARLIIYAMNNNIVEEIRTGIQKKSKIEELAESLKLSPGMFGVGVDLNKPKMRVAKLLSKIKFK